MGKKRVMAAPAKAAKSAAARPRARKKSVESLSTHDESAKQARLVEAGPAGEDIFEIDYSGARPRVRLIAAGTLLVEGELCGEIVVEETRYDLAGAWDWCCFHSDEDGSYLELELGLTETLKIERQFFLGRGQHRLVCGETVVSGEALAQFRQTTILPVATGVKLAEERTTREVRLKSKERAARLIPLHLPQERIDSTAGLIAMESAAVRRSHVGTGTGLFMALAADWHPERTKAFSQWRTLTVTEEGQKLSRDQAGAYRLRLGEEQWLIYRQIHRSTAARCVLGYHTRYETVVGRVLESGAIKELVQIT
jgi:hypothetical protein